MEFKNLNVNIDGYGVYDGYSNHQILEEITKYKFNFISRGEIVLNNKIKATSPEFFQEISQWFETQKLELINVCYEQFTSPSVIFFLKKKETPGTPELHPLLCCLLAFNSERLNYDIFGLSNEIVTDFANLLDEKFKVGEKPSNEVVKFAFWQRDVEEDSALTISNNKCPSLDDIEENYAPELIERIKKIIDLKEPYLHGKIILYHGDAGSGKTHLIRALARAWNEMHNIIPEVIIDPEDLYETPKYLTSVLLNGISRTYSKTEPPFRLIIAEDCDQLFSANCRNQTGFGGLLNTIDGLLGQGQKLIFVFTANEAIESIDPAILRPGRCLQNLEIPNWTRKAAEKWFKNKGAEDKIKYLKNEISLAEMYALLNNTMHAETSQPHLGFK